MVPPLRFSSPGLQPGKRSEPVPQLLGGVCKIPDPRNVICARAHRNYVPPRTDQALPRLVLIVEKSAAQQLYRFPSGEFGKQYESNGPAFCIRDGLLGSKRPNITK